MDGTMSDDDDWNFWLDEEEEDDSEVDGEGQKSPKECSSYLQPTRNETISHHSQATDRDLTRKSENTSDNLDSNRNKSTDSHQSAYLGPEILRHQSLSEDCSVHGADRVIPGINQSSELLQNKSTHGSRSLLKQSSPMDCSVHGTGENCGDKKSTKMFLDELPHGLELPNDHDLESGNHISTLQSQNEVLESNIRDTLIYERLPQVQIPSQVAVKRRSSESTLQPGARPKQFQTSGSNSSSSSGSTTVYNLLGNTGVHINKEIEGYDPLKSLQEQSQLRFERDLNTTVFVKTETLKECEKTLKTWGVLLLMGGPGEGKTTAGLHLLKLMSDVDSRRPLILTDPSQWDHLSSSTHKKNRYVILIDDAFGRTNLVEDLKTRWKQKFPMMLPLIDAGTVCVIFAFRTNIFLQEEPFRTFEPFRRSKPVNLSSNSLSENERLAMLDLYTKGRGVKLSDQSRMQIIQSPDLVSFPLSCYLFTSENKVQYPERFFNCTLEYLSDNISNFRKNDPTTFLVLLLVMFYDNFLPKRVFDVFEQSREDRETIAKLCEVCTVKPALGSLVNSAKSLCQTFLVFDTKSQCFSFMHNSIQDAVIIEFCKDHLSKGLEMCSLRILLEYIRTNQSSCQGIEIVVSQNDFDKLASRLIKELLSPNKSLVASHPAFKDLTFLRHFDLHLSDDMRKEIAFYDREIQSCGVYQYLIDSTVIFLYRKCLNQHTTQNTFNHEYIDVLSIDSIPACFVLNGADRAAIHLLQHMKQNQEMFSRHANITLVCSFYMNDRMLVDELIELGAEISFDCFKALSVAPKIDTHLVEMAAGILSEEHEEKLWSLLTLSLEHGHFECIKHLVVILARSSRKMQLEEFCRRLLIVCHYTKPSWISLLQGQITFPKIIELLFSQNVTCCSDTCVLLAAGCHDLQILKSLLNYGGNVHCKDETGQNPLHLAALYGSKDTVMYLINQKVEKHARDNDGYTPLHRAAQSVVESCEKIQLLADEKAQLIFHSGESVLDVVIRKGDIKCLENLAHHFSDRRKELGDPLGVAVAELAKALSNNDRKAENVFKEKWIKNMFHIVQCLQNAQFSLKCTDVNIISCFNELLEKGSEGLCKAIFGSFDLNTLFELFVVTNRSQYKSLLEIMGCKIQELINTSAWNKSADLNYYLLTLAKVDPLLFTKVCWVQAGADVNVKDHDGCTPLYYACRGGDTAMVECLVQVRADVNTRDQDGWTPLHYACKHGDTAMVECLVKAGADVNLKDQTGLTSLHYARKRGDTAIAECLVKAGVNLKERNGRTPLYNTCEHGDIAMVECWVGAGAEVNVKDTNGLTPLHNSCERGDTGMVECLVKAAAKVNVKHLSRCTPLHVTSRCRDTAMVEFLARAGADVNVKDKDGRTPLHNACKYGDTAMVECLVKAGVEVNVKDQAGLTSLHYARDCGDTTMVECLVKEGADVNLKERNGRTPLYNTCEHGDIAMVECLVGAGAKVNVKETNGWTPLHNACERGNTSMVEYLVQADAEVNVKDLSGCTPLHFASRRGDTAMVECLVRAAAKVNVKSFSGYTPLHFASRRGDTAMVECLVRAGADVNVKNKGWLTPLHCAFIGCDTAMVECLVQTGSNVNVKDKCGGTYLHYACRHGDTAMVECLVKAGAEMNVKDIGGETALHYACRRGDTSMVEHLVKAGTDVNGKNKSRFTPLHYACTHGDTAMVECLVKAGADLNVKDKDGWSPFHCGCERDDTAIVEYLVKEGADEDKDGCTP